MKLIFDLLITTVILLVHLTNSFTFASISVEPETKIINTVTRYKFTFDRTQDDNLSPTPYSQSAITPTDTVTVTVPNTYTISTVTCTLSVNGGTPFAPTSCIVSGFKIIISGIVTSNTFVSNVILWVNNILNPSPAIVTDYFYGSIGSDISGPGFYASSVTLKPAQFLSCLITFTPNTVNSTSDMIITAIPTNQISTSGSIKIQLPTSRRWSNDLSQNNLMPISSSMACSNKSNNVKSTFQCVGDSQTSTVTASNLFSSSVSTSFSFSINNFLSPPTEQPSDPITITSYMSGAEVDTCITYVTNLSPKLISTITITSSNSSIITVNRQYLLRFSFIIPDTVSQTDTITLNFPSGTQLSFSTSTISSNFSVNPATAIFDSTNLILYLSMLNQGRTFSSGTTLVLTIGTYTAPPSIQPTNSFILTFYQNGFRKIQGTTTLVASPNTISGSATMVATTVNSNTSYIFSLTTSDTLTSSGRIKIILPPTISILTSNPTCASLTGVLLSSSASCSFNVIENSITLSSLNISSSNIPPQTMTITINGLRNPISTLSTSNFSIFIYYRGSDSSLVASGSISGVTATTGLIDSSRVSITSSSYIVNDQGVSYFIQLNVSYPIPAGGYIVVYLPPDLTLSPSSVPGHCAINIASTSYVPCVCTSDTASNGFAYLINFTNPFSIDLSIGSIFILRVSSIITNPSSTRPSSSFAIFTFHSNGFSISKIQNSISIQMNTADSFQLITVGRSSNKNYDLTSYSFTLRQKSPFESSSVILITFPTTISSNGNSICSLSSPTSTSLSCSYSSSIMRIILPSTSYSSNTNIVIQVTNIRNPPSFSPSGSFIVQSKTSGQLFIYSYGLSTTSLVNNLPTSFQALTYEYIPAIYGQTVALKINFDPSESGVTPNSLQISLANSFTLQTLSCSFADFAGSCRVLTSNTIEVTGSFISSLMSFSITGFKSPNTVVTDYTTMVSFDSGGYKLDEALTSIIFRISCILPCRTCDLNNATSCNSCYSNDQISPNKYYDQGSKGCFETCVDGKFPNDTSLQCISCDTNCLTCRGTATFCLTCNSLTSFKFLHTNNTSNTQRCVNLCPTYYYADSNSTPPSCKSCASPCKQCTTETFCINCVNGYFFYQNQCFSRCPTGVTIENNSTNNCDFCNSNCLTCSGTVTTCLTCNQTLLIYQNQCRTSCPSPLVPQNGTCGACDPNCKTCSINKYNCTSCDTSTSFAFLLNNLCLNQCPETYYKNIGSGICSLCSSVTNLNCRNCSSVSTCLTCDIGFVFHQQNCLNYIPTGFVNISGIAVACVGDCLTCSNATNNCTSCVNNNFHNFQCLVNCPSGFVPVSKICQSCTSPCRTCSVVTDNCTSCLTNLSPNVFFSNFQCLQTCPDGTYPTQTNYTCVSCRSPCQYCNSLTSCTSCLNGFFLSGTSCLTVCSQGFTGVDRQCQQCLGNCATCSGSTTTCTSCKSDTYFMAVNSSCVTSCGTGLFIDFMTRTCVTCSPPCKTCTNTSDSCLSCTTGILFNNQCINQCPEKYFIQSNQCFLCPINCSSCLSLVVCTTCAQSYVLYNGFCIVQCPSTHALVVNSVCTKCSTTDCHKCTSADFCINCESGFSLHNGACLGTCPSGFETNGTHCIDTNKVVLTTNSAAFPVPFSIASVVIIIASLMSKLQFSHTFMAGSIFSLLSIIQWGALGYFLYLQFINYFSSNPLPFYVGAAALGYLYILNILGLIIQNCTFCYDKDFKSWLNSKINKFTVFVVNFIATIMNHKFRNILFSKLFTFSVFTAQLESNSKFKVLNIFSFLSLIHSGAAIFAAAVAIQNSETFSQIFYSCIDVMVATGINSILAFFNVMKPKDFFYEKTPDGFQLKKKINIGDDTNYYQQKIEPQGKAGEDESGFTSNIYRVQAGTGFTTNELLKIRQNSEYSDKDYSFGSLLEKNMEEISIQAVQQLPQKSQDSESYKGVPQIGSVNRSKVIKVEQVEACIQAFPLLERIIEQKFYNQQIVKQRDSNQSPRQRTIFYKENKQSPSFLKNDGKYEENRKKVFDSYGEPSEKEKVMLDQKEVVQQNKVQREFKEGGNQTSSQIKLLENKDDSNQWEIQQGQGLNSAQKKPVRNVIFEEVEEQHEQNQTGRKTQGGQVKDEKKVGETTIAEATKEEFVIPKQKILEYQRELENKIKQKDQQIVNMKKNIEEKQKQNENLKNETINIKLSVAGKLYRKKRTTKKQSENEKSKISSAQEEMPSPSFMRSGFQRNEPSQEFINQEIDYPLDQNNEAILFQDEENSNNEVFVAIISKPKSESLLQPQINQVLLKEDEDDPTSANEVLSKFNSNQTRKNSYQGFRNKISLNEIDQSIGQENEDIIDRPLGPDYQNVFSLNQEIEERPAFEKYQKQKTNINSYNKAKRVQIQERATIDLDTRKTIANKKQNPLKTLNKFAYEEQEKNISESGDDSQAFNKIYRGQILPPFQTDKEQTEFKTKPERGMKVLTARYDKIVAADVKNNGAGNESEHNQVGKNSLKNQFEAKQIKRKSKLDLEFGPDIEQSPYIQEQEQIGGKKKEENDDLKRYYEQSNKKSRQKSKKKKSHVQLETEKIYLQRQDAPRKKK